MANSPVVISRLQAVGYIPVLERDGCLLCKNSRGVLTEKARFRVLKCDLHKALVANLGICPNFEKRERYVF